MGKFNLADLLNPKPQRDTPEREPGDFEIAMISVHDLVPSEDNFYSIDQIEDLAQAIELAGKVMQNLTVVQVDGGKYKVISGHRRRLACLSLTEGGKAEYEHLPCVVERSEEDAEARKLREELMLIAANSQRIKTDWDKVQEVARMREILEKFKEKQKLPGRTREIIAEALQTTPTQIARADAVERNLIPELKNEMKAGTVGISVGYELSGLPEQEQKEAAKTVKEKGGMSLKEAKERKLKTTGPKVKPQEEKEPPLPGQTFFEEVVETHPEPEPEAPETEAQKEPPEAVIAGIDLAKGNDATGYYAPQKVPEPTIHELKMWPEFFDATARGLKPWEYRKNDRDFKTGDILRLRRYDPEKHAYTGDKMDATITYIVSGGVAGIPEGYVIMTTEIRGCGAV